MECLDGFTGDFLAGAFKTMFKFIDFSLFEDFFGGLRLVLWNTLVKLGNISWLLTSKVINASKVCEIEVVIKKRRYFQYSGMSTLG